MKTIKRSLIIFEIIAIILGCAAIAAVILAIWVPNPMIMLRISGTAIIIAIIIWLAMPDSKPANYGPANAQCLDDKAFLKWLKTSEPDLYDLGLHSFSQKPGRMQKCRQCNSRAKCQLYQDMLRKNLIDALS